MHPDTVISSKGEFIIGIYSEGWIRTPSVLDRIRNSAFTCHGMTLALDGNSEMAAIVWSKIDNLICVWHLFKSTVLNVQRILDPFYIRLSKEII